MMEPIIYDYININEQIVNANLNKETRINEKLNMTYDENLEGQIAALESALSIFTTETPFQGQQALENILEELKHKLYIKNTTIEDIAADYDQHIDLLVADLEFVLHSIADMVGLETLKHMRQCFGKEMSKLYRLQKEHYDLQKQRYEECKLNKHFEASDREFIEFNKSLNNMYICQWEFLRIQRSSLSELIAIIDPTDQDIGFDEDE